MINAFDGDLFESIQSEILEAMSSLISDLDLTDNDDEKGPLALIDKNEFRKIY